MSFVAVAIGGGALLSAGVGVYSANKAADTQANAASNSLAFQQQAFNTSQNNINAAKPNYQPYLDAGAGATYSMSKLLGIGANGQSTTPDYSGFYNSPDYQFAQQQGNLGTVRTANAQGLNLSGGMLKDLDTFNSGLASQQYGNYYNKLMGLSQQGENAAAGLGNLATGQATNATNAAGQIGNTTQAVGQAQASGIVGSSNAITGAVGSGISNSLLATYLGKSPSAYDSNSYGGGNPLTDANGGSSSNPLPGLSSSDYGTGY